MELVLGVSMTCGEDYNCRARKGATLYGILGMHFSTEV